MEANTITMIRPALTEYLHQFDDCMEKVTNRWYLLTYVSGRVNDLEGRSVEAIGDATGSES
jgi:hypothetical protein